MKRLQRLRMGARLAEEWLRSGVVWQPLSEAYVHDPYPIYRRLRERDPLHRSRLTNYVVVTRYADVDQIFRDYKSFSSDLNMAQARRDASLATRQTFKQSMLATDPPDHTRLRRLVNKAFTPRVVAKMESHIRASAHALLDAVGDAEEFDLIKAFAVPLPSIVIAGLIGVPEKDVDRFKLWADRWTRVLEPIMSPDAKAKVLQTDREFAEYFTRIIEERRREPRDDLVSRLVEAEDEGSKLDTEETKAMLRLLLVAGNETTTNLIGNGMLALLDHPHQFALLREQPELVGSAVEELLRFDAPVKQIRRITVRDAEVGGRTVKAGTVLVLLLGAANRDAEKFERPDELDITRPGKANISFGRGIHHCMGAPLARLEGRIALEVLMERFPEIGFGRRRPKLRSRFVLRALEHLDVRVRRHAA